MPSTEQHALSTMVPTPTCFRLPGPSQLERHLLLSSHPLPHRAQGKLSTRAARSERRRKEGVGVSKPGSHCQVERGEASLTSSVLSDGPGSCRETPLFSHLPTSLFSRIHLSQYMYHLNLGRPQSPLETSPKTHDPGRAL